MRPVRNHFVWLSYILFILCFGLSELCVVSLSSSVKCRRKHGLTSGSVILRLRYHGVCENAFSGSDIRGLRRRSYTNSVALEFSSNDNERKTPSNFVPNERALGISVLLTVPLAWGTYTPVVKYLYAIQPPVPGFVFSAAYYLVSSFTLWTLVAVQERQNIYKNEALKLTETNRLYGATTEIYDHNEIQNKTGFTTFLGGIELGSYLFLGNVLQVVGLKTVPADRAGFLVQLTTIMVPLIRAAMSRSMQTIPRRTWLSCFVAFAGVIIIDLDDNSEQVLDALVMSDYNTLFQRVTSDVSGGDVLIILAAFAYSLHVVRLGRYAMYSTPLNLAATKAATEAFLTVALVACLIYFQVYVSTNTGMLGNFFAFVSDAGKEIVAFFSTISESIKSGSIPSSALLPAAGAVLWTGWITSAYTIYAQSFGQSRVNPTEANLIYSMQPLFTALFAWLLVGETLGLAGVLGGTLIAVAIYIVSTTDTER